MVCIQILYRGQNNFLWCYCRQYAIWIIFGIINRQLGTLSIIPWYGHDNIPYTIAFSEIFIWRYKLYIINPKECNRALYLLNNTDPNTCPTEFDPYLIPTSADGFFMGYSNSTEVIIYFVHNTSHTKQNFHLYIYECNINLHLDESMSLGDLILQDYPSGV